jgi:hypothetical protein
METRFVAILTEEFVVAKEWIWYLAAGGTICLVLGSMTEN